MQITEEGGLPADVFSFIALEVERIEYHSGRTRRALCTKNAGLEEAVDRGGRDGAVGDRVNPMTACERSAGYPADAGFGGKIVQTAPACLVWGRLGPCRTLSLCFASLRRVRCCVPGRQY